MRLQTLSLVVPHPHTNRAALQLEGGQGEDSMGGGD